MIRMLSLAALVLVAACNDFKGFPRGTPTSTPQDPGGGVPSTVGTPDLTGAVEDTIADDFEDGVLDQTLWEVRLPFAASNATEAGGELTLTQRPYFMTADNWVPELAIPLIIEFDWRVGSGVNNLTVVTRSDGEWRDLVTAEVANGTSVHLSAEADHVKVLMHDAGAGAEVTGGGTFPDYIPFTLDASVTYRVRIVDAGASISVFIDDLVTPLLVAQVATTYTVNRVVFFNRETDTGSDFIDNVSIDGCRVPAP